MTFLTFLHPTFRETQDLISLATIIYFEKVKKKEIDCCPTPSGWVTKYVSFYLVIMAYGC